MKRLKSLKQRVARFVSVLSDVALEVVGKTKPGKRSKPWLSPEVREKIKHRNKLRKNIREKRDEWKEACKDVSESIKRAKEESWRKLLEDVVTEANNQKLWGIIKSLNGSPVSNARNEAMKHGQKSKDHYF